MEKQMTLSTNSNTMNKLNGIAFGAVSMADAARNALSAPLRLLGRYYSAVLERPVSMAATKALTTTQLAFFLTVLPADYSLVLRFAVCAWFVKSLLRCRKMLG